MDENLNWGEAGSGENWKLEAGVLIFVVFDFQELVVFDFRREGMENFFMLTCFYMETLPNQSLISLFTGVPSPHRDFFCDAGRDG